MSEVAFIRLTKGMVTQVNLADGIIFIPHKWCASKSAYGFYAKRSKKINGHYRSVYLHREIAGCPKGKQVDHINGDTLDNRRENLRIVDQQKNLSNRKGYKPCQKPPTDQSGSRQKR